jgi:molybdopterin synthase sulfur carrier subunit
LWVVRIRVKFFGDLYEIVGTFRVELEIPTGLTVRELVDLISHTFNPKFAEAVLDKDGKLKGEYVVLINGKAIEWLDGLSTKLNDNDEVVFLPPAEGG